MSWINSKIPNSGSSQSNSSNNISKEKPDSPEKLKNIFLGKNRISHQSTEKFSVSISMHKENKNNAANHVQLTTRNPWSRVPITGPSLNPSSMITLASARLPPSTPPTLDSRPPPPTDAPPPLASAPPNNPPPPTDVPPPPQLQPTPTPSTSKSPGANSKAIPDETTPKLSNGMNAGLESNALSAKYPLVAKGLKNTMKNIAEKQNKICDDLKKAFDFDEKYKNSAKKEELITNSNDFINKLSNLLVSNMENDPGIFDREIANIKTEFYKNIENVLSLAQKNNPDKYEINSAIEKIDESINKIIDHER